MTIKPKAVREATIENELVRRVEALGGIAEKTIALGSRGYFDRTVILPAGRVAFAEIKRPRGGVVSAHQRERYRRYKALGAEVHIIKSLADIERLLSGIKH